MYTLTRYLEQIVDPTWDDFHANSSSERHAFLACVAIYHSIDRAAEESRRRPSHVRQVWCSESLDFRLVDIMAHHFKHLKSSDERAYNPSKPGLPIGRALGFDDAGDKLDLHNLYYVIRDAVRFVHRKAGTEHPRLPDAQRRIDH